MARRQPNLTVLPGDRSEPVPEAMTKRQIPAGILALVDVLADQLAAEDDVTQEVLPHASNE
jgi:hypothetical protein